MSGAGRSRTPAHRRTALVVAVCALQALLVVAVVAPRLSARLLGEELRVAVAPVDPVDPFRGAYVALDYPDLLPAAPGAGELPEGEVFVPLERAGDLWRGTGVTPQRPEGGRYLACASDGWELSCGIDSLFASQDEALRLEEALADGGGVATLSVDDRGRAAVVAVAADGDDGAP